MRAIKIIYAWDAQLALVYCSVIASRNIYVDHNSMYFLKIKTIKKVCEEDLYDFHVLLIECWCTFFMWGFR
jgi:hypothetical protein